MKTICGVKNLMGLVLVALILVVVGKITLVSDSEQSGSLKTGVVNMFEVFNKFKKRNVYQEELTKAEEEEKQQLKKINVRITDLQKQLDSVKPESELWYAFAGEIDVLKLQKEQRIKSWNKRMSKKINEQLAKLYNEIRDVIDKYAQEKGYSLVLKTESSRLLEGNQEEMSQMGINIRTVLYHEKAMDITNDIIKILNGE